MTSPAPSFSRRPSVGRSVVQSARGVVSSSSPLAAAAGVAMLQSGGHAVDAAVAAAAVVCVTEPMSNGPGGDLFAIVCNRGESEPHGLNASGWSSSLMTPAVLGAAGFRKVPRRGVFSVTVPGAVAGWIALHERFGRLPLTQVLQPAITAAEEGFPVSQVIARLWLGREIFLRRIHNGADIFLPQGRAPVEGELFRNPALGATLGRIARDGHAGFYRGETAEAVLKAVTSGGAPLTASDLADFQAEWVSTVSASYGGWRVHELPPQGQGIAALMMLAIMKEYPIRESGLHSADTLHHMIEAKKLAYADMLEYVGDPRFSDISTDFLLDPERLRERATLINPDRAATRVVPDRLSSVAEKEGGDTIYLSAVDRDGNIVSLIQSVFAEFGSGVIPDGCGFVLQNRGALFTVAAGHPNTLAPGKRPLHTIIPGCMESGDRRIAFGIMGGWNQAQAHAQFVSNIADHDLTLQEAIEAGRFCKASFAGADVNIEHLVPEAVRRELSARGHRVGVPRPRSGSFGWGQAVATDGKGSQSGASEPRHDGAAIPEAAVLPAL